MHQHLTMDTGHSGGPEKKASGTRICNQSWWQVGSSSGHPVFQGISPLGRGILKKKINRDTIHINGEYGNIGLLYRTVHSANQLCINGAVTKWCGTTSGEASQSRLESTRKTSPEIQMKQEDLKSLVDIPRLPHTSGNRMLQNLKDFNSMPCMSKIEYLRTTAKFNHPIEKGHYYVTTTLEYDGWRKRTSMCKEYTAPRNREDSKPYASIDAETETGPVLNIEIATIIDVPGIEVQVPSQFPRILRMDSDKSWSRKICE